MSDTYKKLYELLKAGSEPSVRSNVIDHQPTESEEIFGEPDDVIHDPQQGTYHKLNPNFLKTEERYTDEQRQFINDQAKDNTDIANYLDRLRNNKDQVDQYTMTGDPHNTFHRGDSPSDSHYGAVFDVPMKDRHYYSKELTQDKINNIDDMMRKQHLLEAGDGAMSKEKLIDQIHTGGTVVDRGRRDAILRLLQGKLGK